MKKIFALLLSCVTLCHGQNLEFENPSQVVHAAADVTTITAEFPFTNRSEKAVKISKSDPGCSCISVRISDGKFTYKPGESGVIKAEFDMSQFSGTVDKMIGIWFDDSNAELPNQVLKLQVHIPVLMTLEPKTLQWELAGDAAAKTIEITVSGPDPILIEQVNCSSAQFVPELKTIEAGKRYQLVVTPTDVAKPGIGVIRLHTNSQIPKHRVQQAFAVIREGNPAPAP